jgi:tetratricopeptide (TPR) repeat protein
VDSSPERADRLAALADAIPKIPLLEYRVGICSDQHAARLAAVHAAMPEFVDAHFVLGRYALRSREAPDPDEALRRFRAAAESFPSSTAIPMSIGNLYQSWEAWTDALTSYDHVLSVAPTHPDAQLGRLISLSHLERHDEAIAAAARLIDGGRWHLGQAFYWRAWNHFNTGSNHSARLDADRTRTLMVNAPVFVLSGMIEWRFRRLESAEKEFQEAITMDLGQCEAAFYLGGVRSELRRLPEAIAAMNQARQCYELSIAVRRKAMEAVLAGRGTAQHKARESARQERAIAAVVRRRDEALKAIEALSAYDNRQR